MSPLSVHGVILFCWSKPIYLSKDILGIQVKIYELLYIYFFLKTQESVRPERNTIDFDYHHKDESTAYNVLAQNHVL